MESERSRAEGHLMLVPFIGHPGCGKGVRMSGKKKGTVHAMICRAVPFVWAVRHFFPARRGSEEGIPGGEAEPAEEEAAQDIQEQVGKTGSNFSVQEEGKKLHGVGGKGGEAAEESCSEEEFVFRFDAEMVSEVDEKKAEKERADKIDQNGAVRESGSAVLIGKKGDAVAENGTDSASEGDEKYFIHDTSERMMVHPL